ncbi:peptide N-acetyl-beta-D-glucosaminyl asparaginase amidase A-domain-containing protein [Xylariaceae sp. FL1651]|nr:peptide N-acetyl-beta-D-glucosaminyl asparaginase amidase A-domain-containing protein [Xylariaceae sp. FL1651]
MRTGLLFSLFVGIAWAHPDVKYPPRKLAERDSIALHPFAKYKNLATGANATSTTSAAPTPTRPLLECFQVAEPVLTPSGVTRRDTSSPPAVDQKPLQVGAGSESDASPCAVVLMQHTFANSYGAPFVGNYTPPDCDFDRVVINFTTLVKGRQYDRTGVMYLGDTEVWRTSTAEPTSYGIRWEWLKDMTAFLSLWKEPQTVIFDLENIVDSTYTGLLNTTLTATFFKASAVDDEKKGVSGYQPADLIIPISQRIGAAGKPSQFVYPGQNATNTISAFPRNVNRAVFTVDVKGQGNEEFWWSNVPQSAIYTFNATYGEYPGYSPWREVQVVIDGHLAGVSWPFPVIYTGGVVPQLNRPIVGIQAFDISEHEIDISPFLPLLCDGEAHTFTISIVGLDDDGTSSATLSSTTDDEWYITGKIFVWLDDAGSITTGTLGNLYNASPNIAFSQRVTQNATGANETLEYNLSVSRSLAISSTVKTQRSEGPVTWSQSLSYSNIGSVYGFGNDNLNTFSISGSDAATGPSVTYATSYAYPLFSNSTADYSPEGNLTLWAEVDQGLNVEVRGDAVLPTGLDVFAATGELSGSTQGSVLKTWRNATANYYRPGDNSYSTGVGQTHQIFSFGGINSDGRATPLYYRDVSAYNDTVTDDHVEIAGQDVTVRKQ